MKQFLRYTLTLVAILIATTNAWADAATLGAKTQSVTADGITFSLGGSYTINNRWVDYSYTGSGKEATLSWTVPSGYTISVSQITIDAYSEYSWWTQGKGQYKTSKNASLTTFCSDDSWQTITLSSSSYFPLGNDGSITMKAIDRELRWRNIVFTYTKTAHKYNIVFNANGGTGTTQGISNVSYDTYVQLTPNGFTRNKFIVTYDANGGSCSPTEEIRNYTFAGWAKTSNGAVEYADQQSVKNLTSTNGATVTLYAKWNEPDNATLTLPTATKTGAVLEGWYLGDTKIGEAGDTYTPTSSVTLTAKWIEKYTPEINGSDATILVGEEIPNAFTFKNTSNPTAIITKKSISDIRNGEDVITYDATENKIIAHNAGVAEIYFVQDPTSTIEGGTSATYTITVNKNTSSFKLNFADKYFVDDEIDKRIFFTEATNSEVAIQVSDKTADNRTLFTYHDSILKANGDTLNADSETTTITVTQPENYKWTSKTLTKEVLVKKHQTNFAWNDGESLECYVDDKNDITNLYTKASDNTLPVNFNIEVIERGYGNTDVVTLENGVLEAIGEGKVVVTASQAVDRKWTDFSTPITINVKRYDVSATLNPTTTVWNATHSNPFSVSISPANGETITDFIVGESSNSTVATYNASSKTIQTYYTSGSANFQITRREDRKYNALDQTLTLTVNANWGCNLIENQSAEANYSFGNTGATYSTIFSLNNGIGDTLKFDYKLTEKADYNHYLTPQYSLTENDDKFNDIQNSTLTTQSTTPTSVAIILPAGTKRLRFKRTSEWWGTKSFSISNITVTRAQYIRPTEGERALSSTDTLKLPTVAIDQPSSQQFNLKWSACTDIKIVWNNPKFSISTTNITARDGSQNITITCNTSEIGTFTDNVIIYNQEQMETFPISCKVYTKWITDSISGSNTHSMKVDQTWGTDFYFPIQKASPYPTTDGAFHYAIINPTFVDADPADRNPNNPNEVISYNNGVITAHNAGTAILTIKHEETDEHFASEQFTCTLTVSKHVAERQWKDPVYYNDTISNYFTTTDTISPIVIVSETDTDVAKLIKTTSNNSLDLITFNKEASTIVTVSQAENYKWNGYSEPHTITPIDQNNHVTFTLTQENYISAFKHSFVDPAANDQSKGPDWQSGGIYFGGEGAFEGAEGWNWNEKYYIIQFTGIPDSIYFDASRSGAATGTIKLSVSEGKTPDNLTEVWSNSNKSENNKIIRKLNPDSRYLKFSYTGNLWGLFKNITVTELNKFEARPDTLDFGTQYVDNPDTVKTFDFHYANAGYKVNLKSTDSLHFTVSPTYIDTIGGEKYGTIKDIQVTYHPTEVHNTVDTDAKILIWDEAGHQDTVFLVANTIKSKPTLYWTKDWSAKEPIVILNQHMPDTVAKSTNGYKVKYRSDDESILKIAPDSLSFIAVGIGETYITAHADSDRVYLAPDTIRKLFHVTDKQMQYIVWEDNLTDLCIGDKPIPLTAQVWVMTDAANNTWEYSPEQTAKIQYRSTNTSVVSVNGNILSIHGKGELLLEASVPADSTYVMAKAQVPVRVYDCSIACTDADLVIPIVGMQLEDELHFDPYQTWDNEKIVEIDTSKGIPGNLTFTYRGVKEWTVLEGKIRVFESTDGGNTWNQVLSDADAVTPEDNTTQYSPLIPLSPNATHIKFERFPNNFSSVRYGSHYVQFITVLPAHYIKTVPDDIHFGNVYVGNSIDTTINVLYSSIRSDLQLAVSEDHLSIDKTTIIDECGAWDTVPLKVSLRADAQIVGAYHQYVTIKDPLGEITDTVHVYANVVKNNPTVTWNITTDTIRSSAEWETKKTAFASSGAQVFYEVTEGNQMDEYAYLNDNGKMILLRGGTITARAYIKETSVSNEVSKFHDFFIIVDPLFEDTHNDHNWLNDNNWNIGRTPWATDSATIAANKHVSLDTVIITEGLSFESGGSIHITHEGGLTVGAQGIQGAATDGSSIIIDNNPQGAGFLRISPSAREANKYPYFTMNFTTRAFNEGVPRDETWQYMGAPGNNATFKDPFKDLESQTLIYHWDETKGWTPYTVNGSLPTWQGYALTQSIDTNHTYQITAQAIQGTKTIDLTYTASGMKGDNLFVNSFTAPIDITKIDSTTDVTGDWKYKTFYFFNTGSWNDWQGTNPDHTHDDASSAGHYYAVPLFSAPYLEGSQTIVPPMQGVYVHTDNADVSITLDYTKHVWNGAAGNLPMRAPQKQSPDFQRVRIQVSSENSGADRMYIIQVSSTTRDYDNGYDGKNINAKGQVNIYTNEPFGKMEVSCANNIDSMYIGLRTGSDTHYTLTFGAVAGDSLYLQDLENDSIIPIFDDEQYHFTAEPNAVNNNRFLLLSRPYKAPNSETSTPETDGDEPTKIWSVGKVIYIANAPVNSVATLYTVSGHLVLSNPIANTQSPAILDVSYLPEGVYILRLNDQVYKFVCK